MKPILRAALLVAAVAEVARAVHLWQLAGHGEEHPWLLEVLAAAEQAAAAARQN